MPLLPLNTEIIIHITVFRYDHSRLVDHLLSGFHIAALYGGEVVGVDSVGRFFVRSIDFCGGIEYNFFRGTYIST